MTTVSNTEAPTKLLIVEDESHLARGLKMNLELEGYHVDVAKTARDATRFLLGSPSYAAIVLDVMLPDIDGFELCRRLRESGNYIPVIMLTARSSAEDRVAGLEAGADDYLVKPFELDELLARVQSLLRRRTWDKKPKVTTTYEFGEAKVDFETHVVTVRGKEVRLTQLELDLLRFLSENPNRVIARGELLEKVWKLRNYGTNRTVDNFIMRLRNHFEADPKAPRHFISVRGAGYKFTPSD